MDNPTHVFDAALAVPVHALLATLYLMVLPSTGQRGQSLIHLRPHPSSHHVYCSRSVYNAILAAVQNAWDVGMAQSINPLASIICPDLLYVQQITLPILLNFKRNGAFIFIFMEQVDFLPHRVADGQYAVAFSIHTSVEMRGLALAYMLLRFREENIRDSDYHFFDLVGLCFRFTRRHIYGVMYFNSPFSYAHSRAVNLSFLECNGFKSVEGLPTLTWFATESDYNGPLLAHRRYIQILKRNARQSAGTVLIHFDHNLHHAWTNSVSSLPAVNFNDIMHFVGEYVTRI